MLQSLVDKMILENIVRIYWSPIFNRWSPATMESTALPDHVIHLWALSQSQKIKIKLATWRPTDWQGSRNSKFNCQKHLLWNTHLSESFFLSIQFYCFSHLLYTNSHQLQYQTKSYFRKKTCKTFKKIWMKLMSRNNQICC